MEDVRGKMEDVFLSFERNCVYCIELKYIPNEIHNIINT